MDAADLELRPCEPASLEPQKQDYLQTVTAPLDGMWQSFVAAGNHWLINAGAGLIRGYCVVDSERQLLQYCTSESSANAELFAEIGDRHQINAAVVATCEPRYLELCRSHWSQSPATIARMFHAPPDCSLLLRNCRPVRNFDSSTNPTSNRLSSFATPPSEPIGRGCGIIITALCNARNYSGCGWINN